MGNGGGALAAAQGKTTTRPAARRVLARARTATSIVVLVAALAAMGYIAGRAPGVWLVLSGCAVGLAVTVLLARRAARLASQPDG